MDLVIGGGIFGERAVRHLVCLGRRVVIVDPDPECPAAAAVIDSGGSVIVIQGGPDAAFRAFEKYKPEIVFPTAPVHVVAGMACNAWGFHEFRQGIQGILSALPAELVLDTRGASIYLSLNRDSPCLPDCPSPDTCPVTGEDRSVPLHDLLRRLLPDAFILESTQVAPGLGALRGRDITDLLDHVRERDCICVGTACRCHGVVTALVSGKGSWPDMGDRNEKG